MKVINSGDSYEIYSDNLKTYDQLPPQFYKVCFHPQKGFWLEKHAGVEVKESKVYGVHGEKVNKVLNSFDIFNKNMGVILSGDKGIGKSLFSRMLALAAVEKGIPVIIIDGYTPGIASYLEEIEQEIMVLFDEFDKTFKDEKDAQTSMLSLFDGISPGKKMFVVTCNDLRKLNEFLVNRPGRFHYHFRFDYPDRKEIEAYLKDNLYKEYWNEIIKVVKFSMKVSLNFDCLRAIAFELNHGLSFEEAIKDLNILHLDDAKYELRLYLNNGMIAKDTAYIDIFDNDEKSRWMYVKGHSMQLHYTPSDAEYNMQLGGEVIKAESLRMEVDFSDYDNSTEEDKKLIAEAKALKPEMLVLKRVFGKSLHYTL